jgi:hypothetical protein
MPFYLTNYIVKKLSCFLVRISLNPNLIQTIELLFGFLLISVLVLNTALKILRLVDLVFLIIKLDWLLADRTLALRLKPFLNTFRMKPMQTF